MQASIPTAILRFMEPQIAFDTHAFVKRLTGAGMPEAQARIVAEQQARIHKLYHQKKPEDAEPPSAA